MKFLIYILQIDFEDVGDSDSKSTETVVLQKHRSVPF